MKRTMLTLLAGAALILALVPSAVAKGPGGGGGGGGGEETVSNNLSVPTIMVGGGAFTGVTCPSEVPSVVVPPSGDPLSGFSTDPTAYYYVQGVHTWQAQCYSTSSVLPVTAKWGDNLTGTAKLQVGKPIRVELGLFDTTGVAMDGYMVAKLQPEELDRKSAYGTLATSDVDGFHATTTVFNPVRVFDGQVTFGVKNVSTGVWVVPMGSNPTAEINSTGSVVYGYNLRVSAVGEYEITFATPSVTVVGVNSSGTYTTNTVSIVINVVAGGGGGGGRK